MTTTTGKVWISSALVIIGCSGGQSGHEGSTDYPGGSAEYRTIEGDASGSMAEIGLCDLVRHPMFEAAGLYEVEALIGVREDDLWNPGTTKGFTYVHLSLMDGWHDAESMPVARILGGPQPSGKDGGWRVSLDVGEIVGLLLTKRVPENRSHYGLHVLGTFRERENGGYSNGQLFTERSVDAAELGRLIEGLAGEDFEADCPYDELPHARESMEGSGEGLEDDAPDASTADP